MGEEMDLSAIGGSEEPSEPSSAESFSVEDEDRTPTMKETAEALESEDEGEEAPAEVPGEPAADAAAELAALLKKEQAYREQQAQPKQEQQASSEPISEETWAKYGEQFLQQMDTNPVKTMWDFIDARVNAILQAERAPQERERAQFNSDHAIAAELGKFNVSGKDVDALLPAILATINDPSPEIRALRMSNPAKLAAIAYKMAKADHVPKGLAEAHKAGMREARKTAVPRIEAGTGRSAQRTGDDSRVPDSLSKQASRWGIKDTAGLAKAYRDSKAGKPFELDV